MTPTNLMDEGHSIQRRRILKILAYGLMGLGILAALFLGVTGAIYWFSVRPMLSVMSQQLLEVRAQGDLAFGLTLIEQGKWSSHTDDRKVKPEWQNSIDKDPPPVAHEEFIPFSPPFAEPPTVHICLTEFIATTGGIAHFRKGKFEVGGDPGFDNTVKAVNIKKDGFTLRAGISGNQYLLGAAGTWIAIGKRADPRP